MGTTAKLKYEKILDTSLMLFAEKGYHGADVPTIAKKANVGAGTIYRYFKNKEDLVNSVYQTYMKKLHEAISSQFPSSSSSYDQYIHIMNRLIQFATENKEAFIFIETHNHADYLDDESKKTVFQMEEFLCEFINNGKRRGEIQPNLPCGVIISLAYGSFVALFKKIEAGLLEAKPEMLETYLEAVWQSIKA